MFKEEEPRPGRGPQRTPRSSTGTCPINQSSCGEPRTTDASPSRRASLPSHPSVYTTRPLTQRRQNLNCHRHLFTRLSHKNPQRPQRHQRKEELHWITRPPPPTPPRLKLRCAGTPPVRKRRRCATRTKVKRLNGTSGIVPGEVHPVHPQGKIKNLVMWREPKRWWWGWATVIHFTERFSGGGQNHDPRPQGEQL